MLNSRSKAMFNNKKIIITIITIIVILFVFLLFVLFVMQNSKTEETLIINRNEINSPEKIKDNKITSENMEENKVDIIKKAKVVYIDKDSMSIDAYIVDVLYDLQNIEKLSQAEKNNLLKKIKINNQTLFNKTFIKKVGENIEVKKSTFEFKDIKLNDVFVFKYKDEHNGVISGVSEINFSKNVNEFPESLSLFGNSEQMQNIENKDEIVSVERDEKLKYFYGKILTIDKEKKIIEYSPYVSGQIFPNSKKYYLKINDMTKLYKTITPQEPLDGLANEISFDQILLGQDIYVLDILKDNFTEDNIYIAEKVIIK